MAKRIGIMLPTLFTVKGFHKLQLPVIVQPKLEGDRLRCCKGVMAVALKSSGDKLRTSVPHIEEEIRRSEVLNNIELDGELYKHGMKHSEIRSIVSRTQNLHENHEVMKYHVYDIVSLDTPQGKRINQLRSLLRYEMFEHIKLVPSHYAYSLKEVQQYYEKFLKQGYEGIIIRSLHSMYKRQKVSTMLKLKPRVSDSFKIIGVIEEVSLKGEYKNTLGAFRCATSEGKQFNVGTGVTDNQRKLMWTYKEILIGKYVKIRFQGYTVANQVPKMQAIDKAWASEVESRLRISALT